MSLYKIWYDCVDELIFFLLTHGITFSYTAGKVDKKFNSMNDLMDHFTKLIIHEYTRYTNELDEEDEKDEEDEEEVEEVEEDIKEDIKEDDVENIKDDGKEDSRRLILLLMIRDIYKCIPVLDTIEISDRGKLDSEEP